LPSICHENLADKVHRAAVDHFQDLNGDLPFPAAPAANVRDVPPTAAMMPQHRTSESLKTIIDVSLVGNLSAKELLTRAAGP